MAKIDRDQLNHPKYAYCVFQHTLSSLEDCLTILSETGSIDDAEEYQGQDGDYIKRLVDVCKDIAEYSDD